MTKQRALDNFWIIVFWLCAFVIGFIMGMVLGVIK